MKTGILTFSNALNPGAVLQAFSLYKGLEEKGNAPELIDYHCDAIVDMHRPKKVFGPGLGLKARLYGAVYNIVFFPRRVRYRRFVKKRMHSEGPYTKETIKGADGSFDLYVTGSDQVFNLDLTGGDTTYYLDFVNNGRKASFAAGAGVIAPQNVPVIKEKLETFDYISVREKMGQEQLKNLCGIDAEVVPDPVFLHTGEEWRKLLKLKDNGKESRKKGYVLLYLLYESRPLYKVAEIAAAKYGLKVVVVTRTLRVHYKVDRVVRNAGPREFLQLIAGADYVVTNSFHGTAFSIIFEKPFNTLIPAPSPERIIELLEATGHMDRAVWSDRKTPLCLGPVEYNDETSSLPLKKRTEEWIRHITKG